MDEDFSTVDNHHRRNTQSVATNKRRRGGEDGNEESLEGEAEVWKAFASNFQEVQAVLDRNRVLIQQVNANQQSRIHEKLVENVNLIQEINGNISKIVSLYSGFSDNFSRLFHQRRAAAQGHNITDKADN